MVELIKEHIRVAKKDHHDDSAEFLIEAMDWTREGSLPGDKVGKHSRLKFCELRAVAKLKANGWKIKKGQTYIEQHNKQDGEIYVFRTMPEILRICIKHKLYVS